MTQVLTKELSIMELEDFKVSIEILIRSARSFRSLSSIGVQRSMWVTDTGEVLSDLYRYSNLMMLELEDFICNTEYSHIDKFTLSVLNEPQKDLSKMSGSEVVEYIYNNMRFYVFDISLRNMLDNVIDTVSQLSTDFDAQIMYGIDPPHMKSLLNLYSRDSTIVSYIEALINVQNRVNKVNIDSFNLSSLEFRVNLIYLMNKMMGEGVLDATKPVYFMDKIDPLICMIGRIYSASNSLKELRVLMLREKESFHEGRMKTHMANFSNTLTKSKKSIRKYSRDFNSIGSRKKPVDVKTINSIDTFIRKTDLLRGDYDTFVRHMCALSSLDREEVEWRINKELHIDELLSSMESMSISLSMILIDNLQQERKKIKGLQSMMKGMSESMNTYLESME